MEDVDFRSWTSEWQVVVGAVGFFGWCCMYGCIVVPMQMCIGWLCCRSPFYFQRESARRETTGLLVLMTAASLFLIIYGTLKHSPALAVVLIIAENSFCAAANALVVFMVDVKKLNKVQHERLESFEKELQKNEPDISTILAHGKVLQVDGNEEPKVDGNEEPKELQPVSAYSDFEGCGLLECTLVFAVQMMLYIRILC